MSEDNNTNTLCEVSAGFNDDHLRSESDEFRNRALDLKGNNTCDPSVFKLGSPVVLFLAADSKACGEQWANGVSAQSIVDLCADGVDKVVSSALSFHAASGESPRKKLADMVGANGRKWIVSAFSRGAVKGIAHMLRMAEESHAIDVALFKSRLTNDIVFEKFFCINKMDIENCTKLRPPMILHLSSHGNARQGRVNFVLGSGVPVPADEIVRIIKKSCTWICIVILAVCHSDSTAKSIAAEGVAGCTIGVRGEIEDSQMVSFTEHFYQVLLDGCREGEFYGNVTDEEKVRSAYDAAWRAIWGKEDQNAMKIYFNKKGVSAVSLVGMDNAMDKAGTTSLSLSWNEGRSCNDF